MLSKFGKILRAAREDKDMTQEGLAFKAKLSVYYISKMERGKSNPSLETLHRIAKALDTTLSDLLEEIR